MAIDAKTRKREWYERNRETETVRMRDRARDRKATLVAALGGKCMDCGIVGPSEIYDFDHRDPNAKTFEIASGLPTRSMEKLLAEAEGCDLVCANCHRIRTRNSLAVARKVVAVHKARRTPAPGVDEQLAEKRATSVMWRASEAARRARGRQTPAMKERAEAYARWERDRDTRLAK